MKTLHINVTNKVATFQARDGDIVCGNTDYQIAFTFDTEWDEHQEKTARFIWNGQYTDIPFTGNTCPVPMVRGASQLTVGVYAGELRTTTPAEIGCRPSVLCVGGEPVEADQRYISEAHRWADDAYTSAQVATDAEVKALNAQMWAEEAADQARQSADRAWSAAADAQAQASEAVEELRTELSPRINRNTEDITILGKKVTNLEQGITPDPFVTDTTGIVPVNALPYAEVVKVGGMTYRDEATNTLKTAKPTSIESRGANLVINEYKDKSGTKNGVTFTVHEDGSVTANGTAEALTDFGLRYTSSHYLTLEPGKTYTLSGCPKGGGTTSYRMAIEETGTYKGVASDKGDGSTFTANIVNHFLFIRIASGATVNNITFKPMLVEGDVVVPFKPYRADAVDTLEIPEAVQALDGYGLGINSNYYNRIDWDKRQFVQTVKRVELDGTENWSKNSYFTASSGFSWGGNNDYKTGSNSGVCSHFETKPIGKTITDAITFSSNISIVPSSDFGLDTVDKFKAYLAEQKAAGTPVTVVFILAGTIETDISDILPEDNFIEVEGGGTIVAVNENNLEAPTEITYMTKEV